MKLDEIRRNAKITNKQEQAIEEQFFTKKTAPGSYEMVAIEKIDPDPGNPRTSMDPEALNQLAETIKEKGIIHPLNLLLTPSGRYSVEEGHRRFAAAKIAGKTHVPAIVIMADDLTDEEKLERQLIENLHNEELPPFDAAEAMRHLSDDHGLKVRQLAYKLGLPKSTTQDYLNILKIPIELREQASTLPKSKIFQVSSAPASQMPELIDQAQKGATVEQVRAKRQERPAPTYFRKSYKLKAWTEKRSGNEVTIKLKNIEADEEPVRMIAKILRQLAKEITQQAESGD